jgi:hypothetical protein
MRSSRKILGLALLAGMGIWGCAAPNPRANLREKHKEAWVTPPENDSRYDRPPDLSEYLNKRDQKNPFAKDDFPQPGGGMGPGITGGMGGGPGGGPGGGIH